MHSSYYNCSNKRGSTLGFSGTAVGIVLISGILTAAAGTVDAITDNIDKAITKLLHLMLD